MKQRNDDFTEIRNEYLPMAQWLQQVLATTPQHSKAELATITDNGGQFGDDYHLAFYRQLPDFVLALLNTDTREATIHFAPLLFHLIGCPICHAAYLEIYDAMRAAMRIDQVHTPAAEWPHSMATTSTRTLVDICQLLINQAAAVLRQGRHDHRDNNAWARSLLQQAIYLSSHLMQSTLRQRALRDLVEQQPFSISQATQCVPTCRTSSMIATTSSSVNA